MGAARSLWRVPVWAGLVVCLALAACSTAFAATRTVSVQDTQFVDPISGTSTTNISADDNITWSWGAGTAVIHTTTSGACLPCTGDGRWGSASQTTGTFTVPVGTFSAPGPYPYFCAVHTTLMTGVVNVSPGALHHFNVAASVATTTAGNSFNVTVTAKDQFNNTITSYAGTVHFVSSDGTATLPANNTLISGTRTFTGVVLRTAGVQSITVNDTIQTSKTGSDTVTVNPAAASQLILTGPASSAAGDAFLVTVIARDAFNNLATGYGGTVHFTSSDGAATLPADSTLISGQRTFSVTLATTGSRTVTATDTINGALTDSISVTVTAATCSTTFTNPAAITINDAGVVPPAAPYPSTISVAGLNQSVTGLTVTLNGLNHTFGRDIDVLLVSPGGQKMVIMSDSGGDNVVSNATITLDDSAASPLPAVFGSALVSGTFRPTNNVDQADTFPAPAPAGPYADPAPTGSATLALTFNGAVANGTWSLYITDDQGGGTGSVTSGWSLTFAAAPRTFCNPAPVAIPIVGASALYPSPVTVSGLDGTVKDVTVKLNGYSHTFPNDVDVLLVGPGGAKKMIVMADSGGGFDIVNGVVSLNDSAATLLPDNTLALVSGIYRPADHPGGVDTFPAPAPAAPYADPTPTGTATLGTTFDNIDPNGTWNLYVVDNVGGDSGNIATGWALSFDLFFNTTTALSSNINPSIWGQVVTFTADVTSTGPGTPSGTVTFKDGPVTLGAPQTLVRGSTTLPFGALNAGVHNITATYNGDANFNPSTSSTVVQTVNPASTTTALGSSLNPSIFGQSVTFTATLSEGAPGTPTGTVTFLDGVATLGTGTLNGSGVATFTTSTLAGGSHSITAVYATTGNFAGSTSPVVVQTVNKAATTIAVTSGTNPSTYSGSVTFTATVSDSTAAVPTGNVTFKDGLATLGTTALNGSAQATLTISTLTGGSHSITAVYAGDANFNTSTSSAITQTVNKATPTASVISFQNPSTFSQDVPFRADVLAVGSGVTPTGNVTFKDGLATLGTAAVQLDGTSLFNIATLGGGNHNITAVYNGDGNYNTATSSILVQQVTAADTSTALGSSLNPSTFSQSVTFTATVTSFAGTPAGTVTFKDGLATLGTTALNGAGIATFITSTLGGGPHSITAVYNGNANFLTSTSSLVTQTVNKASTSTARSSSLNPSQFAQSVTFTATVTSSGGTPAGTVTFKDGLATLGTTSLNGAGVATFSTSSLAVGSHSITAVYNGNANFSTSTSPALTQTVNQASTTVALSATKSTTHFRESVTFMVTVIPSTAGTPTGTVTFFDGATQMGTPVSLDGSGQAQITVNGLIVGRHLITAQYSGDVNFPANSSVPMEHNQSPKPH
jgi:subtilisin-like proprotein convertase family protein/plastocyanin